MIGSHVVPLAYALSIAGDGPVLEVGMGFASTPLIHRLCCGRRKVFSFDNDEAYAKIFSGFADCREDGSTKPHHDVKYIQSYKDIDFGQHHWSVVFVDCSPWDARNHVAKYVADQCEILVVHDSDHWSTDPNKWICRDLRPLFRYHAEYRYQLPPTMVFSNIHDIRFAEVEMVPSPEQRKVAT